MSVICNWFNFLINVEKTNIIDSIVYNLYSSTRLNSNNCRDQHQRRGHFATFHNMMEHVGIVIFGMPLVLIMMLLGGQTIDDMLAACAGAVLWIIIGTVGDKCVKRADRLG